MNNAETMCFNPKASLGFIDRYELIRELGGGGFGCVYLAKDSVAGIDVAVKGLPPLIRNNKEELENVRRNFALVSRLHHPNIAAALHLQKVERVSYKNKSDAEKLRVFEDDMLVVMQYAPGVTLSQWRKQFPENKVPFDKVIDIIRQVASSLDYAHEERILHRDVKPANIMIETTESGRIIARVLDFGLAAEIRSSMSRVSQQVTDKSGTRPYMAPEQWLGKEQGSATDQYALAVLCYELLTGRVPFASVFDTGDPVVMMNVVGRENPELSDNLPKHIKVALMKALSKAKEDRFENCSEFVSALEGKCVEKSKKLWGIVAACLLLSVAGAAFWYARNSRETEPEYVIPKIEPDTEESKILPAKQNENAELKVAAIELKVRATQAYEDANGRGLGKDPRMAEILRRLNRHYKSGMECFNAGNLAAATNFFCHVGTDMRELVSAEKSRETSIKVARSAAEEKRAQAEAVRKNLDVSVFKAGEPEEYGIAIKAFSVADQRMKEGDFEKAASMYENAKVHFERASQKVSLLERMSKIAGTSSPVETWSECLKLKLTPTERERDDLRDVFLKAKRSGFDRFISFEDCRKADWSDPYVLYLLGKNVAVRHEGWEANKRLALAFYEKSVEMGCTNALSKITPLKKEIENDFYYDIIKTADLDLIKFVINEKNPCLSMTNKYGTAIMSYAALHTDADILTYLDSIGHRFDKENANGSTPIFSACANTNGARAVSCIKWLISKGANVNDRNYKAKEFDPPYPILRVETFEALNYLMDLGVDITVKGSHGNSLLHEVVGSDDIALVSRVVSMFSDVNIKNEYEETPLHRAVQSKSDVVDKIITLLVDKGADVDARVGVGYMKGFQAIHLAAYTSARTSKDKRRQQSAISALCSAGADVNSFTLLNAGLWEGVTPLMIAVKEGNLPVVEELLSRGADVSLRSRGYNKGYLALHMIEGKNKYDCQIVDKLIFKNCKIDELVENNKYTSGYTLLHLLCNCSDYGMRSMNLIRHLLKHRASMVSRTSGGTYNGYNALEIACNNRNYFAVKVLAQEGCNVSAAGADNDTRPIHIIADENPAANGNLVPEIIDCLVKHGANVNSKLEGREYGFMRGWTPLHITMRSSLPWPIETLVKHGADIESEDAEGRTPLWLGCEEGHVEKVKKLLELGADPMVRDNKGRSLVESVTNVKIKNLLIEAMGKRGASSAISNKTVNSQFVNLYDNKKYYEAYRLMDKVDTENVDVVFKIGNMHEKGLGGAKNFAEALKWYRKAAERGYAPAQRNLAIMYDTGRGCAENDAEALKWYRKAAEQGDACAQSNLGVFYRLGSIVAKDDYEAFKWTRKAAEQGHAVAQASLGVMFADGKGVAKDEYEAVAWYRKAAAQGNVTGINNLGFMYNNGRGVQKDEYEAVKWYRKAADMGSAVAQFNLANMYENGTGVAQNIQEAIKWYKKSADQGNAAAKASYNRLSEKKNADKTLYARPENLKFCRHCRYSLKHLDMVPLNCPSCGKTLFKK